MNMSKKEIWGIVIICGLMMAGVIGLLITTYIEEQTKCPEKAFAKYQQKLAKIDREIAEFSLANKEREEWK